MTDLTIAATITRTLLPGSLAPLNLNDHSAYDLVRYGPGLPQWVFEWASAPSVHGEKPVSGRLGNAIAPVIIRVKGSTISQYETRAKALIAAFNQLRFTLTFSIDSGEDQEWKCYAANAAPAAADGSTGDGSWDLLSLMARYQQVFAFSVPRHPIQVSGVM